MNNQYKWLPFKLISILILGLMVLSIVGPVKYNYDPGYCLIMILYIVSFIFVTFLGMKQGSFYKPAVYADDGKEHIMVAVIKWTILISLIIKVMLLVSSIAIQGLPEFQNVFDMLAQSYNDMYYEETEQNIFRQIDTFFTFIYYFSTFTGLYWIKKIPKKFVALIFVNIALELTYNVFYIGTQRSIITVFILFMLLWIKGSVDKDLKIKKRRFIILLALVLILATLFVNILSARKEMWDQGDAYWTESDYNYDHPLLVFFPGDRLKNDVCTLISYLTQGFYGLSQTFQVKFEWSFMLGSVRGLNSIISQVFPFIPNMTDATYPVRAGEAFGRDGLANWYTIFPWLASDLTFVGALVYMAIVAWLYMRCWIQSIKHNNPISFSVLMLLTIQYVFVVANNQLFIQRGESVATVVLLLVYIIFSKKFNFEEPRLAIQE